MEKSLENKTKNKVGIRNWISFILIGFAGQMAWNVENMYLNKFIFSFGYEKYQTMITATVVISAIVACLATIFMGALSDKVRKRKIFISVGYIIWGIATGAFGLISVENMQVLFPTLNAAIVASISVIILDGIMTFLGSTANDAAFNSYVTHYVSKENRGKVEGVLSILPLIAMLLIFVGLDPLTQNGHWDIFFYIIGAIALVVGILSIFLLPKEKEEPVKEKNSYIKGLLYGFKPSTIKENKGLYVILLAYLCYGIATQVFFPYLIIYFGNTLEFVGSEFSLVMGIVLIVGSLLTVLAGIFSDKVGKKYLLVPTMLILFIGCILIYFVGKGQLVFAIIAGIIMMFGYIFGGSLLNSLVRDNCVKDKEGIFMGVRILFAVTLPMCIGAPIGEAIVTNFSTDSYIGDYGTSQPLPPEIIWIFAAVILLLVFIPIFIYIFKIDKKKPIDYSLNKGRTYKLKEDEFKDFKDENYIPLKEHPNPYFKRDKYLSLNGYWELKIQKEDELPTFYDKKVLVPYALEAPLSGVNYMVNKDDILYYHKEFILPEELVDEHIFIHLLGVDQESSLYINGMLIISNYSGYLPYFYDIGKFIKKDRKLDIIIKVKDVSDSSYHSRGKQSLNPGGIWYTTTSGIYFPIYIESAPKEYIESFKFDTNLDRKEVKGFIKTNIDGNALLSIGEESFVIKTNDEFIINLNEVHPWSDVDPYLYDVKIKFYDDLVYSSIGFRKIEIKKINDKNLLYLNDKEIILKGVLDQGYYYGGNLTPSSYEDYLFDIKKMKELGFNTIRKHIKFEVPFFYYYCDKEGVFVIQDMINGGRNYDFWTISSPLFINYKKKNIDLNYKKFKREDEEGRLIYEKEMVYIMDLLRNSPATIIYTLFNEGWGQFDSTRIYNFASKYDINRLYDTTSGWYDNENSNFLSKHIYFKPLKKYKDKNRAYLLSEFGGCTLCLEDHFYGKKVAGYKKFKDIDDVTKGYKKLFKKIIKYTKDKDMAGFIYTQLSDVEDEVNGIYTFDRKTLKIKEEVIKSINKEIDKTLE